MTAAAATIDRYRAAVRRRREIRREGLRLLDLSDERRGDLRAPVRHLCGDARQYRRRADAARSCSAWSAPPARPRLLLLSSTTFGFAAVALAAADRSRVLLWLVVTVALGLGFLYLEFGEFSGMIAQGAGPDRSGFLSGFFTLVGTHGLHVSIGVLWIFVMIGQVLIKGLTRPSPRGWCGSACSGISSTSSGSPSSRSSICQGYFEWTPQDFPSSAASRPI